MVTLYQSLGDWKITIDSHNPDNDSGDDNSRPTVIGMNFIEATKSGWDIDQCNAVCQNFIWSSVKSATLRITGSSHITRPAYSTARNEPLSFDAQGTCFEGGSTGECISTQTLRIREVTTWGGEFTTRCRLQSIRWEAHVVASSRVLFWEDDGSDRVANNVGN